MQRLKRFYPPGWLPDVAPTRHLASTIKGPAGALVRKMRGEVRERLLFPQQLGAGRIPRQPQRFRVGQADSAAGTAGDGELGKRCRENPHVEHEVDLGA